VIETPTEPIDVSDVIVSDDTHHLSLNAMNGFTCAGTIRFQGYINGHPVQVLVDGGSTDNFLNHVLLSS
jgi:predicted aspartyl protease